MCLYFQIYVFFWIFNGFWKIIILTTAENYRICSFLIINFKIDLLEVFKNY